jgi:hypothetical protein
MQVIQLKDGNGVLSYWQVTGKGTTDDPYVPTGVNPADPFIRSALKALLKAQYNPIERDSSGRQKITIDNITGSLTLATVSTITNALADLTKILGLTTAQYLQAMTKDPARNAYSNGPRRNLVFKNI